MKILWIFQKGGICMPFIFLCSIIGLAIFIERAYFLRKIRINIEDFILQIRTLLKAKQNDEAIQLCNETKNPIAEIFKAGILKVNCSKDEIKEAIEDAGNHTIPVLERYMGTLATIGTVAPLLGFLGTVLGMVKVFMKIENMGGQVNASVLAGGIWEALLTTVAGLIIAIPVLIGYNFLINRINEFVVEMEKSSSHLVEILDTKKMK